MKKEKHSEALKLRLKGYSLTEISRIIDVSKSTLSDWMRNVKLPDLALKRLKTVVTAGQLRSAQNKKNHTENILKSLHDRSEKDFNGFVLDGLTAKMYCCLLYQCEGGKHDKGRVQFTNSDPSLVKAFLRLFRQSFALDESKFRACLHLHNYHIAEKQIQYWSNITQIPVTQFIKPFLKSNTGKRIRLDYPGCIQVRYSDANIVRDLIVSGTVLIKNLGA